MKEGKEPGTGQPLTSGWGWLGPGDDQSPVKEKEMEKLLLNVHPILAGGAAGYIVGLWHLFPDGIVASPVHELYR